MPVQVAPVTLSPVPNSDTYVATIKSRRSATMQPQVDGNLVKIFVKSGDLVKPGQLLMQIDPLKQIATVESQKGTQSKKRPSTITPGSRKNGSASSSNPVLFHATLTTRPRRHIRMPSRTTKPIWP
jgi:pyruvate/2-oxoglutarate dehydrogenase complex dihydrolipoamide acyltransferase (E2) component